MRKRKSTKFLLAVNRSLAASKSLFSGREPVPVVAQNAATSRLLVVDGGE
jgi:hypothetical protein